MTLTAFFFIDASLEDNKLRNETTIKFSFDLFPYGLGTFFSHLNIRFIKPQNCPPTRSPHGSEQYCWYRVETWVALVRYETVSPRNVQPPSRTCWPRSPPWTPCSAWRANSTAGAPPYHSSPLHRSRVSTEELHNNSEKNVITIWSDIWGKMSVAMSLLGLVWLIACKNLRTESKIRRDLKQYKQNNDLGTIFIPTWV